MEQQSKYGDALEIISGKLGLLIIIEVDRLRLQVFSEAFLSSNFCYYPPMHTTRVCGVGVFSLSVEIGGIVNVAEGLWE